MGLVNFIFFICLSVRTLQSIYFPLKLGSIAEVDGLAICNLLWLECWLYGIFPLRWFEYWLCNLKDCSMASFLSKHTLYSFFVSPSTSWLKIGHYYLKFRWNSLCSNDICACFFRCWNNIGAELLFEGFWQPFLLPNLQASQTPHFLDFLGILSIAVNNPNNKYYFRIIYWDGILFSIPLIVFS